MSSREHILLTGVTGYIGGRMIRVLQSEGYRVRCLTRRPEALRYLEDAQTQIVYGDALNRDSLRDVFKGIQTAFYLIHSMGSKTGFAELDQLAARNFSNSARDQGVRRIVYLGGLADPDEILSTHLRSRLEVGDQLRQSGIQVIEFRASIILGSGSLSFEMIRTLVEKLPVMLIPKWVRVKAQPIAVEDVLAYLSAAIRLLGSENRIYEIGGSSVLSYMDLMREYARYRRLKRIMIPVPVLTPKLSSYWLGLVTPLYARIGKKLIDGVRNPTLVRDHTALQDFKIHPRSAQDAIAQALHQEDKEFAETRWSDALSSAGNAPRRWTGIRFGNRIVESRVQTVEATPAAAFAPIRRIGGKTGWYYANGLWKLRGFWDLLAGGVGLRRGRRDAESLRVGDTLDFWRVDVYQPDQRLRLFAEMKLPARAWLQFEVKPITDNRTEIRQTAIYDPIGFWGLVYWAVMIPFHRLIFSGMLRKIAGQVSRTANR